MFVSFKALYLRNYGNTGVDRFNMAANCNGWSQTRYPHSSGVFPEMLECNHFPIFNPSNVDIAGGHSY